MENVSWNDVQEFIKKLNASGEKKYRLPTEAEWEYAARGGTNTKYYWGNEINGDYLWYTSNSNSTTHLVGQKKPNSFGLYDMSGNVWEWVEDWHGEYNDLPQNDPTGSASGSVRIFRGGFWDSYADDSRSSGRNRNNPAYRHNFIGFRLVAVP